MLSKRPSLAVRMMSPSCTSKEELSAASGLERRWGDTARSVTNETRACSVWAIFSVELSRSEVTLLNREGGCSVGVTPDSWLGSSLNCVSLSDTERSSGLLAPTQSLFPVSLMFGNCFEGYNILKWNTTDLLKKKKKCLPEKLNLKVHLTPEEQD